MIGSFLADFMAREIAMHSAGVIAPCLGAPSLGEAPILGVLWCCIDWIEGGGGGAEESKKWGEK